MKHPTERLFTIFPELYRRDIEVLDIGSNPNWASPPYKPLLDGGFARVTGFEADPEAYGDLLKLNNPRERHIQAVVGDGSECTFRHCKSSSMSSIFPPNDDLNRYFWWLDEYSAVEKEEVLDTVRLDDVAEIERADMLKIDVQGGELKVFQGAQRILEEELLLIQSEVLFQPMYVGQPLFSDLDVHLRKAGFYLMRFIDIEERTVRPLVKDGDWEKGQSLMYWADAVYIRDFTKWSDLSPDRLVIMAALLNDLYAAYDLAYHALSLFDSKQGSQYAAQYGHLIKAHGLAIG